MASISLFTFLTTMNMQTNLEKVRAAVIASVPEIMELTFGCEIRKVFWYKTEKDKKAGNVDWMETGHHEGGREGVIVKDGRADFLPMWVDYGDQLDFSIGPNDIVSFEILGRPIRLSDVLRAISSLDLRFFDHCHLTLGGTVCLMTGKDIYWNLTKDDLNLQSQETIDFLAELLTT